MATQAAGLLQTHGISAGAAEVREAARKAGTQVERAFQALLGTPHMRINVWTLTPSQRKPIGIGRVHVVHRRVIPSTSTLLSLGNVILLTWRVEVKGNTKADM